MIAISIHLAIVGILQQKVHQYIAAQSKEGAPKQWSLS